MVDNILFYNSIQYYIEFADIFVNLVKKMFEENGGMVKWNIIVFSWVSSLWILKESSPSLEHGWVILNKAQKSNYLVPLFLQVINHWKDRIARKKEIKYKVPPTIKKEEILILQELKELIREWIHRVIYKWIYMIINSNYDK